MKLFFLLFAGFSLRLQSTTASHLSSASSTPPSTAHEPSPTCTDSASTCGAIGCYDPQSYHCCPGETMLCSAGSECVSRPSNNGTLEDFGCCPPGHHFCVSVCIPPSQKCCQREGGGAGMCEARQECCSDKCCNEDEVCANTSDGWRCHIQGPPAPVGSSTSGGVQSTVETSRPAPSSNNAAEYFSGNYLLGLISVWVFMHMPI